MEFCYIYGLYDVSDVTKKIRYVGKTITPICERLNRHINEAKRESHKKSGKISKKNKWIIDCLSREVDVDINIIETVGIEIWQEREIYWISKFDGLYNTAPGGFGGSVKLYTISYEICRERVRALNIKSKSQWLTFVKSKSLPLDIPSSPRKVFLDNGWISWIDFLGTNNEYSNLKADNYLTYKEASRWVESNLDIKNYYHWVDNVKCGNIPDFIPNRPYRFYSKKNRGWISWVDFLNNNRCFNEDRRFMTYSELSNRLFSLCITKKTEYIKRYKEIPGAHSNPWYYYKDWKGWKNFINSNDRK